MIPCCILLDFLCELCLLIFFNYFHHQIEEKSILISRLPKDPVSRCYSAPQNTTVLNPIMPTSETIPSWRKFEPTPRVPAAGAQRVQENKMVAHGFDTNRILKSSMFGSNHLRWLLITPTLTNYDWPPVIGYSLSDQVTRHYTHYVCIAVLHTSVAGLLARSQYPEGPATGYLGTGFSWFPCV